MKNEPVTVGIDTTRIDRRTHIERINPLPNGESAAWLPRAAQYHAPGSNPELEPEDPPIAPSERKPYMLLENAFVDGRLMRAGETVHLYDHEIGPHHVPVETADDASGEETEGQAGEAIPQEETATEGNRE